MELIRDQIRTNRPHLGETSVSTYSSILKSLFYKGNERSEPINLEWFKDQDRILELLKEGNPTTRKTTLSAVVVLNGKDHSDSLGKLMKEDSEFSRQQLLKQEKTQKQEENWIDYEEVRNKWFSLYSRVKPILNGKDELSNDDKKALNIFMLLTLTTGIFFPPRRSLEWSEMRVSGDDIDEKTDNYIDMKNMAFVFNKHKNARRQTEPDRISFPKDFKIILNKYIKRMDNPEYLLTDTNGVKLTSVKIAFRLNTFFGRKVSTSMLRHIYESHLYKDIPKLTELLQTAKDMGHPNLVQHLEYIKK